MFEQIFVNLSPAENYYLSILYLYKHIINTIYNVKH